MVCPHWKCADDALWCSHEKNVRVCASGEVVLCTSPVAFSELRKLKKTIRMAVRSFGSCREQLLTGLLEPMYTSFLRLGLTPFLNTCQCCR